MAHIEYMAKEYHEYVNINIYSLSTFKAVHLLWGPLMMTLVITIYSLGFFALTSNTMMPEGEQVRDTCAANVKQTYLVLFRRFI